MFAQRRAYSMVEVMIVLIIAALTLTIGITLYNPKESTAHDAALTQLEELKDAVILFNARNPQTEFSADNFDPGAGTPWWDHLPGINRPNLVDPWGSAYRHDYYRGCVYSTGSNQIDDNGEPDDLVAFYRPPSAEIMARFPSPNAVVADQRPDVRTEWRLVGSASLEAATVYVDKKPVASSEPLPPPYDTLPAPILSSTPAGKYVTALVAVLGSNLPGNLADGAHEAQVRIRDTLNNSRRTSWTFRVDTKVPLVYAFNPAPGSTFEFRNPLVSCLFSDASGIDLQSIGFDITTAGGSIFTGAPLGYAELNAPIILTDGGTSHAKLSSSGLSWRPPVSGLGFYEYTAKLTIADVAGNATSAPVAWSWTIDDSTEPQIQIQQPVFGSALTTDCDLDQDPSNGTQIAVVGTTERNLTVSLDVIHAGSTVVSALTTQSNASGYFVFPAVLVKDQDLGLNDVPLNEIVVTAADAFGNTGEARTTVYLFNDNNRLVASVSADPMTTKPAESITFSVWADRGTTPYTYVWDFNDGYTREGVITTPMATESVSHTYLATGAFVVKCQVTDQTGLTTSASQQIYVGTEAAAPELQLRAVPLEVFCGAPGMGTQFQIKIGGKYLGFWRLHVESTPQSVPGYLWYYSTGLDKMCYTVEIDRNEPATTDEWLWQSASSNDFVVDWDGIDNYADSGISWALNPLRKFPSNRMTGPTNREHKAVLEYIDALGDKVVTTCPVVVYQGTPNPRGMQIYSVNRIPNSPQLYDRDLDGTYDFTNANKIDIMAITPESTNPTDWWLSNFPIELHNVVYQQPSQNAITGYSFAGGIAPDGEVFHNWTMESGVTYSAVDGSSGWMPLDLTEREKPDGTHFAWDWPLTAWPETDLGQLLNGPNFAKFTPAWYYPESAWQSAHVSGANQWVSLGNPGMNLAYDGPKRVYAIFRDAGVFPSTQVIGTGAEKASAGVTSVSIFLDRTPPRPIDPPRFTNLEVVGNWSDLSSLSVIATIAVTAEDLSDSGYGLLWGAGLVPNGMVIVRGGTLGTRQVPYRSEVTYDFGSLYKADGSSNLPNIAPNSTLTAVVTYRDNLGNQSVAPAIPTSIDQALATISKFTWTLMGGGGLNFYRKHDQLDRILYSYKQNLDSSEPRVLEAGLRDDIDTLPPTVDHWKLNGAALNTTANTGSKKYEDRVVWDSSDIDPDHFPNPNDRLGYLQARRPWFPWSVEQEATFEVDDLHYYFLILLKADPYVEYRVYKGLRTNANCEPLGVAAKALPADFIENSGNFTFVASVDKVAWSNFNPARVNEGCMRLPGEDAIPPDNDQSLWRDLHASGGDAMVPANFTAGAPYDGSKHWDQVTDLLIEDSTAGTKFETYTYRGCLYDYDGGTVRDIRYKVTANSFAVKAGFVTTPGEDIVTNIYSALNEGYHKQLIKAELIDQDVDPSSNGFGIKVLNSAIEDVGYAGYPPLASGMVSGNTFRIRYSDYSNDFSWMTTGTVQPCIRLEFDGAAPTGASPFNPARVTTSGALVANNIVQPTTTAWYTPPMTDLRGNTTMFSPNITWNILDGAEGTITAHLTYMDQESNKLTAYVTTAQMDANPPSLGSDGIRLWSHPGHGSLYPAGSTFERSGDLTRWTSMNQFTVDYSDSSEVVTFYREFNAAPPAAINVWASYNARPTDGAAGAFDIYGSAAPAPNGNTARWRAITRTFPETCTWVRDWASANAGEQGLNTLYMRLKDASNNVGPVPTPPIDDGQQNGEPTYTATINRDTKSPTSGNVTVSLTDGDKLQRTRYSRLWTNDPSPTFTWTSQEPVAAGDPAANSGIIGANVAMAQTDVATNPIDVYPPMLPTDSGLEEQTETFSTGATEFPALPACQDDGPKRFAAEAVDLVGNANSLATTTFNFDATGPNLLRTNFPIEYRVYVAVNTLDRFTPPNGGWGTWDNKTLPQGAGLVDSIKFACNRGVVYLKDVTLWNGATKVWPITAQAPSKTRYEFDTNGWQPRRDQFSRTWNGGEFTESKDDRWLQWQSREHLYSWRRFTFKNYRSEADRKYKVDDVAVRLDEGGATDTILADNTYSSDIGGGWFQEPWSWPGSYLRADFTELNKDYKPYLESDLRRFTIGAGESFQMTIPVTTVTEMRWKDWDRTRYEVKKKTSALHTSLPKDTDVYIPIDMSEFNPLIVYYIEVEVDIQVRRDKLKVRLYAPDDSYVDYLWDKDSDGGGDKKLVGKFGSTFSPHNWDALEWKNDWKISPDYNGAGGTGIWRLRVRQEDSNDPRFIENWKLTIVGQDGSTDPQASYTAEMLGPGYWDPAPPAWTGPVIPPVNLVSNSSKITFRYRNLDPTTATYGVATVEDPGWDGTATGTGIGVVQGDLLVPDCFAHTVALAGTPGEWSMTASTIVTIDMPQGDVALLMAARDLLGNVGEPITIMEVLSDAFPPEMGALTATRNGGLDIPNAPATSPHGGETYAGCITTDAVVYHLVVDDPDSGVEAYCYKFSFSAPSAPVPGTNPVHTLGSTVTAGTIDILVNTTSNPPLPQGGQVYFNVMVQDRAGTWSETYKSFCIKFIDRTNPVGTLAAIPDGNPDTVNFNNVIQLNRRQHFQGGGAYTLSGSSTDTGGVGIDRIRVSVNGGTTWNTPYTDGTSPWNTTQGWTYAWPDPAEDGDNVNGGTAHAIRVEVRDACGNLFDSTLQTVYVDTIVPAAPAVVVGTPANEPDVMTGTKVGNFSYLLVLTTTPMPAIPAAAPGPDAGVTANTAVGQFISGTAVNYSFGMSPMDAAGNIRIYTRDGAGNVSPATTININNAPTPTAPTLAGGSGVLTVSAPVNDPDAPDRAVNVVKLTKVEWLLNDTFGHNSFRDVNPAALNVVLPYSPGTVQPDTWPFTWNSAMHNSASAGANALKGAARLRLTFSDGKTTTTIESNNQTIDNNQNPVLVTASRTPADAVVRGDLALSFDVTDLDFTDAAGTVWDRVTGVVQYSLDGGTSWNDVPDGHLSSSLVEAVSANGVVNRTWNSGVTLPSQIQSNTRVRIKVFDKQHEIDTITMETSPAGVFELRNQNLPPTVTVATATLVTGSYLSGNIDFDVTVNDPDFGVSSENVDITAVEYSLNGGTTWLPASVSVVAGAMSNIRPPASLTQTLRWNSAAAAPINGARQQTVQLRVTVADNYTPTGTDTDTVTGIWIDNNDLPTCTVTNPPSGGGNVNVIFTIADSLEAQSYTAALAYSTDAGVSWNAAAPATAGPFTEGAGRTYVWNSNTNLNKQYGNVQVRIQADDNMGEGYGLWSPGYTIFLDNNELSGTVVTGPAGNQTGTFNVVFTINDGGEAQNPYDAEFQYSTNGGTTWLPATPLAAGGYTEGTGRTFSWDSRVPAAPLDSWYANLLVRMRTSDNTGEGWGAWSPGFTIFVDNNEPPACTITGPAGTQSGTFNVVYDLTDTDNGQTYTVFLQYSTDGGTTWLNGAPLSYSGITEGTGKTYSWSSSTSLPVYDGVVKVRIRATDAENIADQWSNVYDVTLLNNNPPQVNVTGPAGPIGGTFNVIFTITDGGDNQAYQVALDYSTNGTDWFAATPATRSGYTESAGQTYSWDSVASLPSYYGTTLKLRMRAEDPTAWGPWDPTPLTMTLDNNDEPTNTCDNPTANQAGDVNATVTIADGDDTGQTYNIAMQYKLGAGSWTAATITGGTVVGPGAKTVTWQSGTNAPSFYGTAQMQTQVRDTVQNIWSAWHTDGDTFTLDNNDEPTVTITSPTGTKSGSFAVTFAIVDGDDTGQAYEAEMQYSTDDGTSWTNCPEGVKPYASKGTGKTYTWDSNAGEDQTYSATTKVQIRVRDTVQNIWSAWATSTAFTLDNNNEPTVSFVSTPASPSSGNIDVSINIADGGETQNYTVQMQYKLGAAAYAACSPASQNYGATGNQTYTWTSASNIVATSGTVLLQIRVMDDEQNIYSAWATSGSFTVDNP